jgi:isorenieratene synthase
MERAATTGVLAANRLLERWGVRGDDIWTVPLQGLTRRGVGRGSRRLAPSR